MYAYATSPHKQHSTNVYIKQQSRIMKGSLQSRGQLAWTVCMVCFPLRLPCETPGTIDLSTTGINSTVVLERKMAQEHACQQQYEKPKIS